MSSRSRSLARAALFALVLVALLSVLCSREEPGSSSSFLFTEPFNGISDALVSPTQAVLQSRLLTERQCTTAFPDLGKEIDASVKRGSFKLKKLPNVYSGLAHGRIKDGKLYIISSAREMVKGSLRTRNSVLHALHRAIITAPEPLPDTYFALSTSDEPRPDALSFARRASIVDKSHNWLMPHFAFWSYPLTFVGALDEVLSKVSQIEAKLPWERKRDRVIWRGSTHVSPSGHKDFRAKLVEVSTGKEWADVEKLVWDEDGYTAKNALKIEQFCEYRYIVYTEGVTYSGRLPYHQACASVIITPPPLYLMHTTHLMRPLFSSALGLPSSTHYGSGATNSSWTTSYPASEANIVFVAPDWSDLEETVQWLQRHPEIAAGVAQRQRELMTAYLSPAAEACYWRALISGWAKKVRPVFAEDGIKPREGEWSRDEEGMRFENWALIGETGVNE